MTAKKFLTDPTYREQVLTFTIPHACLKINTEVPYSIGNHLHFTKVKAEPPSCHAVIRYRPSEQGTGVSCAIDPADTPVFLLHRSYVESNQAFLSGGFKKYLVLDGKAVVTPTEAAETKIQSVFRDYPARKKLAANNEIAPSE